MMYLLFFATIFAIFATAPSVAYGTGTQAYSVPGTQTMAEPTLPVNGTTWRNNQPVTEPPDIGTSTRRPYSVPDMQTMAEPTSRVNGTTWRNNQPVTEPPDIGTFTRRPYSDMQTMAEPTSPAPCNEDLMFGFVMACVHTGEGGEGWCTLEEDILSCMQLQYEEVQCEYPEYIKLLIQDLSKDRCHKKNLIDNTQDKQHNWLMVVVLLVPLSLLVLVLLEVARRTKPQVRAATTALILTSV